MPLPGCLSKLVLVVIDEHFFLQCILNHLFHKISLFRALLRALTDVSAVNLHVAISLLRMCGGYCKLMHLARTTSTSLCSDSLKFFDEELRLCFASCLAVDVPDTQWHQAQLCPKLGGLGLCSLSLHSCAAFISSLAASDFREPRQHSSTAGYFPF